MRLRQPFLDCERPACGHRETPERASRLLGAWQPECPGRSARGEGCAEKGTPHTHLNPAVCMPAHHRGQGKSRPAAAVPCALTEPPQAWRWAGEVPDGALPSAASLTALSCFLLAVACPDAAPGHSWAPAWPPLNTVHCMCTQPRSWAQSQHWRISPRLRREVSSEGPQ